MRALILAILLTFMMSCSNSTAKKEPLYTKVMSIHDEVMPKMSEIHKLKKAIRKSKNATSQEVLQLLKQLNEADEGMMKWMHEFKAPNDAAATKIYLQNELPKVQKVADDINNSISDAKKYLDEQK